MCYQDLRHRDLRYWDMCCREGNHFMLYAIVICAIGMCTIKTCVIGKRAFCDVCYREDIRFFHNVRYQDVRYRYMCSIWLLSGCAVSGRVLSTKKAIIWLVLSKWALSGHVQSERDPFYDVFYWEESHFVMCAIGMCTIGMCAIGMCAIGIYAIGTYAIEKRAILRCVITGYALSGCALSWHVLSRRRLLCDLCYREGDHFVMCAIEIYPIGTCAIGKRPILWCVLSECAISTCLLSGRGLFYVIGSTN